MRSRVVAHAQCGAADIARRVILVTAASAAAGRITLFSRDFLTETDKNSKPITLIIKKQRPKELFGCLSSRFHTIVVSINGQNTRRLLVVGRFIGNCFVFETFFKRFDL